MRQISKQILTLSGVGAVFLAGAMVFGVMGNVLAATSRLGHIIVVDTLSGVALNGFDAVSYFTEGEARPGDLEFEFIWNKVPWYFSSQANMEVFARAPEIYAPQFGGHASMSMARGFYSDGNPLIFVVLDNRLYLFYSVSNRQAFLLSDKVARLNALETWKSP